MLLLKSIPLYRSSRGYVVLSLVPPDRRGKITKSRAELENQKEDSQDIYHQSLIEQYMARPRHKVLDDMTIMEIYAWFEKSSNRAPQEDQDNDCDAFQNAESNDEDNNNNNSNSDDEDFMDIPNPKQNVEEDNEDESDLKIGDAFIPPPQLNIPELICDGTWIENENFRVNRDEPPFLKTCKFKGRGNIQFEFANGKKYRLRSKPRTVRVNLEPNSSVESFYTALAMMLPFQDEWFDLLFMLRPQPILPIEIMRVTRAQKELPTFEKYLNRLSDYNKGLVLSVLFTLDTTKQMHVNTEFEDLANDSAARRTFEPDPMPMPGTEIDPEEHFEQVLHQDLLYSKSAPEEQAQATSKPKELPLDEIKKLFTDEQRLAFTSFEFYLQQLRVYRTQKKHFDREQTLDKLLPSFKNPNRPIVNEPKPPDPPHIFITGPAGTGKSFLIDAIKQLIWQENRIASSYLRGCILAAPTGIAAFGIGGETVHTAFSLQVKQFKELSPNSPSLAALRRNWKDLQAVIVDEVSMLSAALLGNINSRLNQVFNTPNALFGNCPMLLVGDFCQLPPVFGNYIFDSPLFYQNFYSIKLTVPKRQAAGSKWAEMLNRMRTGDHTLDDLRTLQSRSADTNSNVYLNPHKFTSAELSSIYDSKQARYNRSILETEFHDSIRLYPTNKKVDARNSLCIETKSAGPDRPRIIKINSEETVKTGSGDSGLDKKCDLPSTIFLIIGAKIMIRRNLNKPDGIVNGSIGFLRNIVFRDGVKCPTFNLLPGEPFQSSFESTTFSIDQTQYAEIEFENKSSGRMSEKGVAGFVRIDPTTVMMDGGNGKIIIRKAFPFILAYAITIHKSQGLGLDSAVISIGSDIRKGGQAYTAMSRVRSIEGILLESFNPDKIYTDLKVLEEEERQRSIPAPAPQNNFGSVKLAGFDKKSTPRNETESTKGKDSMKSKKSTPRNETESTKGKDSMNKKESTPRNETESTKGKELNNRNKKLLVNGFEIILESSRCKIERQSINGSFAKDILANVNDETPFDTEWISTDTIDKMLLKLCNEFNDIAFVSASYEFQKTTLSRLQNSVLNDDKARLLIARRILLFPIWESSHYSLFVLNFDLNQGYYFEAKGLFLIPNRVRHIKEIFSKILFFCPWIQSRSFRIFVNVEIPVQQNSSDCGYHVIVQAICIVKNLEFDYSEVDFIKVRKYVHSSIHQNVSTLRISFTLMRNVVKRKFEEGLYSDSDED